jgi:hypothetical protein
LESEWLEIAYINFDKAILHGKSENGIVEQELTQEQKEQVWGLNEKHALETRKLLRGFL